MKIYLSPSSQPYNAYAAGGTNEQVQCNRIAEAAKVALERNGYEVRKGPEGQKYDKNVAESNAWQADLHIPIHTNAGGSNRGALGLCYPGCSGNRYMQAVYNSVAAVVPWPSLGIQERSDLYELNATRMMAVYIECAFHDKPDSAQWIIDHVKDLGEAIAKGVCQADGKAYQSDAPVQEPGAAVNDFGLKYRAHIQTVGWLDWVHDGQTAGTVGYSKRMEAIQIDPGDTGLKIKATAHIQRDGTVEYGYITKDTVIGTTGQSKRLEAIELEVEGLPAGKNLYIQLHFANDGWASRVKYEGGSFGLSKETQAIRMWVE